MPRIQVDVGQDIKPSKYQRIIFDWIQNGTGSAIIEAVAGSGKTTTIVQALNLIPPDKRAIFLAFNKAIAEELKIRIPSHAFASTFHSAGYTAWRRRYPRVRLDNQKDSQIMKTVMTLEAQARIGYAVVNLVSLAKQRGIRCLVQDTHQAWEQLIDHFDVSIEYEDRNEAIGYAKTVLAESIRTAEYSIDFDDMIYMPVLYHVTPYTYDWVFIDEAQDTNGVRRALAKMMLAKDGRLVAVGDSHQAIYGFTGADSDAMEQIQRDFDCEVLNLSICYRSAKSIVNAAKTIVPDIEAAETAPDGTVEATTYKDTLPGDADVILCRNTAPLVNLAYRMISEGRGCRILGRDIGRGLVRLVGIMKARDLEDLQDNLIAYRDREVRRLIKEEKEGKAQSVEDKVECIFAVISNLAENERTIEDLNAHIERMFQDNGGSILTLSTVHKAKGLEWPRVFIHMPGLMPSKWARQPWQVRQEINLQYVAITRAKKELYYVNGDRD